MKKFLGLVLLCCISSAQAGYLKSGGQYEANLRNVGIPQSAGMVYNANSKEKVVSATPERFNILKSGGQYEANLRNVGIGYLNGLVFLKN